MCSSVAPASIHLLISLPLCLSPSLTLTSIFTLSPTWTSTVMKKDVLGPCRTSVRACMLQCTCTRMCVTRGVMNKDVLCVELLVNHWQCWQLTDKQIDPRPPRERHLAPAHSSQHTHTRIHSGKPGQSIEAHDHL